MTTQSFVSVSCVDSLKNDTLFLTDNSVNRADYLALSDEIKTYLGMDAFIIFRDTVKGEDGQFWIEIDDYEHMWKRITKFVKGN